jgi:hypothetical protein
MTPSGTVLGPEGSPQNTKPLKLCENLPTFAHHANSFNRNSVNVG